MAFGFFRKTQAADIIFHNGQIYTHDPEFPWAEAVACSDGKITAVGDFDAMDEFVGKHTEVIDLGGKFMFPGFIDVHRCPALDVFKGKYLDLTGCQTTEEILDKTRSWAKSHPDADIIFGYGYREDLDPEVKQLDTCCADRPVVLLAASGIGCAVNTVSEQIIEETAYQECVEIITVGYVLNLLMPFDFEEVEADVEKIMASLTAQGITTVLNLQTLNYFESLYQDSMVALFNEEKLRQRFFGSYFMNRPLQPRGLIQQMMVRKTNCSELNGLVQANMLNVYLEEKTCPMEFPQEALEQILLDVVDKGFHIFIEAVDTEDLKKAYETLEIIRNKGYKNEITIASNAVLGDEVLKNLERWEDAHITWKTKCDAAHPVAAQCESVEGAINEMTVNAAKIIGMEDHLGMIEKGSLADFAVFAENPLEKTPAQFAEMKAAMTVLNGKVVYEA